MTNVVITKIKIKLLETSEVKGKESIFVERLHLVAE